MVWGLLYIVFVLCVWLIISVIIGIASSIWCPQKTYASKDFADPQTNAMNLLFQDLFNPIHSEVVLGTVYGFGFTTSQRSPIETAIPLDIPIDIPIIDLTHC